MSAPGSSLWISALAVAAALLGVWVAGTRTRDLSLIDLAWGPLFVVVALVAGLSGTGDEARRWLLLGLTGVWGLRLGAHLTARKLREPGEDRRYTAMRKRHPQNFTLWSLGVFAVQGLCVLIVSLPLTTVADRPAALGLSILPGLLVFALGLGFEAVGDEQLRRFKSDPASSGQVMDRGLWRYTRHPNYFGDACVWWGLWLVALPAGGVWWTGVGPLLMTLLLLRGSGKPMLERDIAERRPDYAEYIRRTSGFLPLPPRGQRRGASR